MVGDTDRVRVEVGRWREIFAAGAAGESWGPGLRPPGPPCPEGIAAPPSHSSISREGAEGRGPGTSFPLTPHGAATTAQVQTEPPCRGDRALKGTAPLCQGPGRPARCLGGLRMPAALAGAGQLHCVSVASENMSV